MLSVFAFSACEKDLYDAEVDQKVTDMKIPLDFNWEMSTTAIINITSLSETPVAVYLDKQCSEIYKIAEFTVIPGLNMPIELNVPTAQQKLYAKYNGNVVPFAINNGKAELTLTPTTSALKTRAGSDNLSYLKKGWSTVMFEDLFPRLGDYDFNDFAANYNYSIAYRVSPEDGLSYVDSYEFDLRVNAVGATKPITPYLRITATNEFAATLDDTNVVNVVAEDGITVTTVSSGKGFRILKFEGMCKVEKDANNKVIFRNTDPALPLSAPMIAKVTILAANKDGVKVNPLSMKNFNFDIFITNGDTEIHKRGMASRLNLGYPADEIEGGEGNATYSNMSNLVWGIDIPAAINHPIEYRSIISAYPKFKKWAESEGTEEKNWYEAPSQQGLIKYLEQYPIQ